MEVKPNYLLRRKVIFLPTVDSTNLYCMREMARLADGTMVVADEQTQGRGRMGRSWYSPKGNLYASLVLKPPSLKNRQKALVSNKFEIKAFG